MSIKTFFVFSYYNYFFGETTRAFRNMDDDGSKALNEEEFVKGIREFGLDLSDEELKELFAT